MTAPTEVEQDAPAEDTGKASGGGLPINFPVMVVEGMETGDGRYIEPGALIPRALPWTIMAMTRNPDGGMGHDAAEVVGRVDWAERVPGPEVINRQTGQPFPEGTFIWRGGGEVDRDSAAAGLVEKRYLTGNSVDLQDLTVEVVWPEEDDDEDGMIFLEPELVKVMSGYIAGTTLCPFPAFSEAYVEVDGQPLIPADDMPEAMAASAVPMWRSADLGDECAPCDANAVTASADRPEALPHVGMFADPELDGPTPLEYGEPDAQGFREVWGHIATWGTCHIGFVGQCKTPPRSASGYAYFMTGSHAAVNDDGERVTVPVGVLTYDTGHAPIKVGSRPVGAAAATAHYDDTGTVGAYVAAGEDAHGIWVHGIVAPGADVEKMAATPPSGDWRPIGNGLEMVGALHVNVQGYPVPRAMVASGRVVALVAAGVVQRDKLASKPVVLPESVQRVVDYVDGLRLADERARLLAVLDEPDPATATRHAELLELLET